jgi:hypothetical protein
VTTHGADFHIREPQQAYLTPAKLLAMTAIGLLYDEAVQAKQIIGDFKPVFSKADYLTFARGLCRVGVINNWYIGLELSIGMVVLIPSKMGMSHDGSEHP